MSDSIFLRNSSLPSGGDLIDHLKSHCHFPHNWIKNILVFHLDFIIPSLYEHQASKKHAELDLGCEFSYKISSLFSLFI